MTLPSGPYTYNDPRILYDEICFFYNGDGYDSVCFAGPTAVFVPNYGSSKKSNKSSVPFINVFIHSAILEANNVKLNEKEEIVRFSGENTPISIFVNKFQFGTKHPYVHVDIDQAIKAKPDFEASIQFLEQAKNKTEVEIQANNLATPEQDVKISIVESYEDIRISSSYVENESNVDATLIKKNYE